ncbi:MAG: hypothetical protein ACXVXU_05165 [Blastococcus sp.]
MGRHAAADGGSVHPLVAAALAHRPADSAGAHRDGHQRPERGSDVGWPEGPRPGGGGLGWPEEMSSDGGSEPAEEPTPAAARRWLRFFRRAA